MSGNAPNGLDGIGRMLQLVCRHLEMDVAFVAEFVGSDWVLRHVSSEDGRVRPGHRQPLEDSLCRRITDGRLDCVVPDARVHPETSALPVTVALDIGAYVGIPIMLSDGTLYGTFCSFRHRADPSLCDRDARFLSLLGSLISERLEAERAADRDHREGRARIDGALEAGLPRIVLQPIVDLDTEEVWAFEALSRFDAEPARPPDDWFAEAHRVGRGVELELRAMSVALEHLPQLGRGHLTVNLSPGALCSADLEVLLHRAEACRVVLEVTEHELVEDISDAQAAAAQLRKAGFRLAIDDVGAGYAGLTKIVDLAPEVIKLDRALVEHVDTDPTRQALVSASVGFAAVLGSSLVAEGIETRAELDTLRRLGIRLGQGFLLARPAGVEHWT